MFEDQTTELSVAAVPHAQISKSERDTANK